jgi:ATP:corrinoid adenosyltransferase
LRAAAHAGIDIPPKVWSDMADVVQRLQEEPRVVGVVVTGKTARASARSPASATARTAA